MYKSITQDMVFRQSLMKYTEKYCVIRASRTYNKGRSYIYFWRHPDRHRYSEQSGEAPEPGHPRREALPAGAGHGPPSGGEGDGRGGLDHLPAGAGHGPPSERYAVDFRYYPGAGPVVGLRQLRHRATVCLGQLHIIVELSEPAIHTILGVGILKVLENIFEHNDGPVFGRSSEDSPPDGGKEEDFYDSV